MIRFSWRIRPTIASITGFFSLSFLLPGPSHAAILNSGFESGYQGWELACFFACQVAEDPNFPAEIPNNYDTVPSDPVGGEGAAQAKITAAAVNASDVETFLGLAPGNLSNQGVLAGSAIRQTFQAQAGSELSFSFQFLPDSDSSFNDLSIFSFYSFNRQSAFTVNLSMFPIGQRTIITIPGGVPDDGWYTIGFASLSRGGKLSNPTKLTSPSLLVDDVRVTPPTSVPTPALLPGLIGLGFGVLRKRRSFQAEEEKRKEL